MADPFTLDQDSLTLGEYVTIEELTGWEFPRIFAGFTGEGVLSPKFLLALQFVAGRRVDPAYTLEDASRVVFLDLDRDEDTDGDST